MNYFQRLAGFARADDAQRAALLAQAAELPLNNAADVAALVDALGELPLGGEYPDQQAQRLAAALLDRLARSLLTAAQQGDQAARPRLSSAALDRLVALYPRITAAGSGRSHLLRALAADAQPESLAAFARLLAAAPPSDPHQAALALTPLFQSRRISGEALFPALWACLERPELAVAVLDLANFLYREQGQRPHAALPRVSQLVRLLGLVAERLGRLAERPAEFAEAGQALPAIVQQSLGLITGLCDALALCGDPQAIGKLNQVLQLPHRRARLEAAAALARLGEERGTELLVELAADHATRARALAYLDELGQAERAAEADRSPLARAAGELAHWLSEPYHYGLPPSDIELVEARRMLWPAFAQPVDCFLLRFWYRAGDRAVKGIGLAGPLTHALSIDVEDLPPDDIFALFAGWAARHAEIVWTPAAALGPAEIERWQAVRRQAEALDFEELHLVGAGRFFGEEQWVARGARGDAAGALIWARDEPHWFVSPATRRPPGPEDWYNVYKGRRLFAAFAAS